MRRVQAAHSLPAYPTPGLSAPYPKGLRHIRPTLAGSAPRPYSIWPTHSAAQCGRCRPSAQQFELKKPGRPFQPSTHLTITACGIQLFQQYTHRVALGVIRYPQGSGLTAGHAEGVDARVQCVALGRHQLTAPVGSGIQLQRPESPFASVVRVPSRLRSARASDSLPYMPYTAPARE